MRGLDSSCSGCGQVASSFEHGNKASGFLTTEIFFEDLSDC
jgi:hypothetical protein